MAKKLLTDAIDFFSFHFGGAASRFILAAATNDRGMVNKMIDRFGPQIVNKTHAHKDSALMCAAACGHARMVEHLLQRGADIHYHNGTGATALIAAAKAGHKEIFDLLLAYGADPDKKNKYGQTAAFCLKRALSSAQTPA